MIMKLHNNFAHSDKEFIEVPGQYSPRPGRTFPNVEAVILRDVKIFWM